MVKTAPHTFHREQILAIQVTVTRMVIGYLNSSSHACLSGRDQIL